MDDWLFTGVIGGLMGFFICIIVVAIPMSFQDNFEEGYCEAKNMSFFEEDSYNDTFTCISDLGTTKTFLKQKINKTFKVIEVK